MCIAKKHTESPVIVDYWFTHVPPSKPSPAVCPFHVDGMRAAHTHETLKTPPFPCQATSWQHFQVNLPSYPGLEGLCLVFVRAIPFGRAVIALSKVVKSWLAVLRTSAQAPKTESMVEGLKTPPPKRKRKVEAAIDREALGCSTELAAAL